MNSEITRHSLREGKQTLSGTSQEWNLIEPRRLSKMCGTSSRHTDDPSPGGRMV